MDPKPRDEQLPPDSEAASQPAKSERLPSVTVFSVDPDEDRHWAWLHQHFASNAADVNAAEPLRQVLKVARDHRCHSVVVECEYNDPDYRSEYWAYHAKVHERIDRDARRLHFFEAHINADDVHKLPAEPGYIGYSVLRPTVLGITGRTVLKPPSWVDGAHLTTVTDRPSLFGQELEVVGVPFMQQDGELLRCAHAAVWACHYVAADADMIARHPTAQIATLPRGDGRQRALPSSGLTVEQTQAVFNAVGIPAYLLEIENLPKLAAPLFADVDAPLMQEDFADAGDDAENPWEVDPDDRQERMLRAVAMSINSGLPALAVTGIGRATGHAFPLVGWRERDDRIELIASDDRVGPYEVLERPYEDMTRRDGGWVSLMLPLPQRVLLNGQASEVRARSMLRELVRRIPLALREGDEAEPQAEVLTELVKQTRSMRGTISVRARLLSGRRYKELVIRQKRPEATQRLVRLARLPHWVWIVEFTERTARKHCQPCVLAEFVFDSTSHDEAPRPLLLSTPYQANDFDLVRRGVPIADAFVESDGTRWRSLISDNRLLEDEPGRPTSTAATEAA